MARSCLEAQTLLHYLQHKSYGHVALLKPVALSTGVHGSVTRLLGISEKVQGAGESAD